MAKKEDKFDVKLGLTVDIKQNGESFHDEDIKLNYPGMNYLQMNCVLQAITQFGQTLTDLGWTGAEVIGWSPEEIEIAEKVSKGKGKGLAKK